VWVRGIVWRGMFGAIRWCQTGLALVFLHVARDISWVAPPPLSSTSERRCRVMASIARIVSRHALDLVDDLAGRTKNLVIAPIWSRSSSVALPGCGRQALDNPLATRRNLVPALARRAGRPEILDLLQKLSARRLVCLAMITLISEITPRCVPARPCLCRTYCGLAIEEICPSGPSPRLAAIAYVDCETEKCRPDFREWIRAEASSDAVGNRLYPPDDSR